MIRGSGSSLPRYISGLDPLPRIHKGSSILAGALGIIADCQVSYLYIPTLGLEDRIALLISILSTPVVYFDCETILRGAC